MNSDTYRSDNRLLFKVNFHDGYTFRHMITIIKAEVADATMIISENEIIFSFKNSEGYALHNIRLRKADLLDYDYAMYNSEGKLIPEYPVAFNTDEMLKTLRILQKKDSVRMYIRENNKNLLAVQQVKNQSKEAGKNSVSYINILTRELRVIGSSTPFPPEPNVKIISREMAEHLAHANNIKCTHIELSRCVEPPDIPRLKIKGIHANKNIAFEVPFPFVDYDSPPRSSILDLDKFLNYHFDNRDDIPAQGAILNIINDDKVTTIPASLIKALSKIHSIAGSNNLVKLYFSTQQRCMKMKFPVGGFGEYELIIREIN